MVVLIQGVDGRSPFDAARVSRSVRRVLSAAPDGAQRADCVLGAVTTQLQRWEFMRGGAVMHADELQDIVEAAFFACGDLTGLRSYIIARFELGK